VEEGQGFASFGSEVIAQLAETGTIAGIRTSRIFPPAHCIPCSGPAEKEMLPSMTGIVEAALKMRPHDYDC
jgi:2-oxoisovalerate dehydrogenase E1 component